MAYRSSMRQSVASRFCCVMATLHMCTTVTHPTPVSPRFLCTGSHVETRYISELSKKKNHSMVCMSPLSEACVRDGWYPRGISLWDV